MKPILKNLFKGQMVWCAALTCLLAIASCSNGLYAACSAELRFDPETKLLWHKNKIVGEVHLNTSTNTMRIFYPTNDRNIFKRLLRLNKEDQTYRTRKYNFETPIQP